METTQIKILTQVIEEGKVKGGFIFDLNVDEEIFEYAFLYEKEKAIQVIEQMLSKHDNKFVQYRYISHEIAFHKPVDLCTTEQFTKVFQNVVR